MGRPKEPAPANLICAITYSPSFDVGEALFALEELYGPVELKSGEYLFDHYTSYYRDEMGDGLRKFFVSFKEPVKREAISRIKLETNQLEEEFSLAGKRQVNLDPGYVAEAQLVLATTKGYAHRIYLANGIYAEVTLIYSGGTFRPLEWTYPDYRDALAIGFFNRVRELYLRKLRERRCLQGY